MNFWLLAIMVVASYFIGCISFGRILAKTRHIDITKKGSGNPGATNMFRNVGARRDDRSVYVFQKFSATFVRRHTYRKRFAPAGRFVADNPSAF